MLRNQLYGRICIVQKMMLEAVKSAQRQFPTRIFYKQEAAALIKIGDKGKNHIIKLGVFSRRSFSLHYSIPAK